jgi:hypothetical protein
MQQLPYESVLVLRGIYLMLDCFDGLLRDSHASFTEREEVLAAFGMTEVVTVRSSCSCMRRKIPRTDIPRRYLPNPAGDQSVFAGQFLTLTPRPATRFQLAHDRPPRICIYDQVLKFL